MFKKITSLLLCVFLLVSVLPNVVFAADTLTILTERKTDDSSVSKPLCGSLSEITYKIQLNGVDSEAELYDWSVSPEGQGISVGAYGNVRISGDTVLDSFNLTATSKADSSVTATKVVAIEAPMNYDFDNTNTATPKATATDTADGNVYMTANSTPGGSYTDFGFSKNLAMTGGQSTVKFKFRVPLSNASATNNYAYQYFMAESGWGTYIYIQDPNITNKTFSLQLRPSGGTNQKFATGITYDQWHEMKIEYNFNSMKYKFYVDGVASSLTSIPTATQTKSTLKLKYDIDDVRAYSGFDYTPEVTITDDSKSLLIPTVNNRTASVKFEATSEDASTPISWSLAESYAGVTIDPSTGVVTVSKAASDGMVTIKASQGGTEKTATLSLKKIDLDLEANSAGDTPWSRGAVAIESDGDINNKYMAPSSDTDVRYFPGSTLEYDASNVVIEQDLRSAISDKGTLYVILRTEDNGSMPWAITEQLFNHAAYNKTGTSWNRIKIIINFKAQTYSCFVNDNLVTGNKEFSNTSGKIVSELHGLSWDNLHVDNVKIYNVTNTQPQIASASLPDVLAGYDATLSYAYFDEGGMDENCTDIKWYISDSATEGFELIENENELTLSTSNDMIGKYLKVIVIPAHDNQFDTTQTITGAPAEKICRVLDMSAEVTSVTAGGEAVDFDVANITADDTEILVAFNLRTAPETEKTFAIAVAYYIENELIVLDSKPVTLNSETDELIQTLTLKGGAGIYKIFAWDNSDNTPLIKTLSFK